MVSTQDYADAEQFQLKHIELIKKHKDMTIFLAEPLKGLEGKALEEASKIKEIAENHRFKVSEVYTAGAGQIQRLLIGDEHGTAGDSDFMRYHSQIAGIVKGMISAGILGSGDEFCYEEANVGVVDYRNSHGNVLVVGGKRLEIRGPQPHIVQLLDALKSAGMNAVCNDHPSFRKLYLDLDKDFSYLEGRSRAASSKEISDSLIMDAYKASLQRDIVLFVRVSKGMADYLSDSVGIGRKAVQVMGTTDLFTDVVQNRFKSRGISYMTILPVLDRKA